MWAGYFRRLISGKIVPVGLEKGQRFVGIGLLSAFWPLTVSLRTVMGLWACLQMYCIIMSI